MSSTPESKIEVLERLRRYVQVLRSGAVMDIVPAALEFEQEFTNRINELKKKTNPKGKQKKFAPRLSK
ncbi:MAG TPA: hypothetical protein VEH27_00885 [Methylomirabilota bacterium]|nr:hypothetical protein [Methylomirabilota bacterium]